MEFKSEYYTSWFAYKEKNNVAPENEDVIRTSTQVYEEQVFDFTMWLVF
jgi:hypothetical protein